MAAWVLPSSNLATLSFPPSLSVSLSFPGVTGWDIKTGVLINCATLPPAALNMFWPWQAVFQATDSLALFLFYRPCLCIIFHSFTFYLTRFPIWKSDPSSLPFLLPNLLFFNQLCIPSQFDPNKWTLIPIDKVIPSSLNYRISCFSFWTWEWVDSYVSCFTCTLPCTHPYTPIWCTQTPCSSDLYCNSFLPSTHWAAH